MGGGRTGLWAEAVASCRAGWWRRQSSRNKHPAGTNAAASMTALLGPHTIAAPWFEALAAFVSFNTIIYVGLALTKLIPRRKK